LSARQTKFLTTGIHRVFLGLKFESNAAIGQKGNFSRYPEVERDVNVKVVSTVG
jgi:hypothetical protein